MVGDPCQRSHRRWWPLMQSACNASLWLQERRVVDEIQAYFKHDIPGGCSK